MKIYCDFCGSQIETTENKTCPHCGGYYSTDEELLKEKERVRQLNELEKKKQELDIERMKLENQQLNKMNLNDSKFASRGTKGCLLGITMGLSILGIFFILMIICIIADSSGESKETKRSSGISSPTASVAITYSLKPIEMPTIPEISVPDINVPKIDMPEITVD